MAKAQPSLRRHLLRQVLAPLLGLFILGSAVSYYAVLHFAAIEYDRTLYDMVHSLAQEVRHNGSSTVLDLPPAAENLFLWDDVDNTYYRVWGERSGQIAGYPEMTLPTHGGEDFHGVTISESAIRGERVRLGTLAIRLDPQSELIYVQVGETQRKRSRTAQTIMLAVLGPQLLLIMFGAYAVSRGVKRGLTPLHVIARQLETGGPAALEPIPEHGLPHEVLALTRALHHLVERLQAAVATQQRFVADTAHQLRTPLTAIKLNLDRAFAEAPGADVRSALDQVRISTDRAIRLSAQLLSLARVEDVALTPTFTSLDLRELARSVGAHWITMAETARVELVFESGDAPVMVSGNPDMLWEMISNLIDNALKYGSVPGAVVTIAVDAAPQPTLKVMDQGPGIDAAQRTQVVQRFSRGDRGGDGTGLGLAIVAETARLHHAELQLSDGSAGRGLMVTVRFPAL